MPTASRNKTTILPIMNAGQGGGSEVLPPPIEDRHGTRTELHENRGLTLFGKDWNNLQGTLPHAHVSTAGCWKGRLALGLLGP